MEKQTVSLVFMTYFHENRRVLLHRTFFKYTIDINKI